ncbi:TetR/AcrR family transcriptional regulator [Deinococcus oregonensis]|uniref:TetR/AcrR family transcriptional regulator n=1 Tax=Deinococcus oregonensis TaxID=1805970 RepID=A0ABV6B7B1_9DEIO
MKQTPPLSSPPLKSGARDRILEAARTLFYRRGVNNVGIDEVIRESGVAKATLYHHFSGKDDLILEFMRQGDTYWLDWLKNRTQEKAADPRGQLLALFDTLAEWFALPGFRGCLLTNVSVALAEPEHAAHELLREHKTKVQHHLRGLAAQAGAAHPEQLSRQLMLLLEGATAQARTYADPGVAEEAKNMARLLLQLSVAEDAQRKSSDGTDSEEAEQ